jgi:hypothetical protein
MKRMTSSSVCVAGILAFGAVAIGQQPPAQPQAQSEARASTDQQITVTGCVQSESDYRKAKDAGKGGVAGTGIGAGNEFVLIEATASASASGRSDSSVGTSGAAMAYELTGSNEGMVAQYVGRRVEISGKRKVAEVDATGQPSGGPTAGRPPSGVDAFSKDLKLRELEVISVKEATGSCPTSK